jgi:thioredoxin
MNVTDFQRDVIEKSKEVPVLVDFWAAWCAPCRILGPTLEKVEAEADGSWILAKVDTESFPDIAMQYGVRGIPNCKLFVDGSVVDEFVGAYPEPMVREFMTTALGKLTA